MAILQLKQDKMSELQILKKVENPLFERKIIMFPILIPTDFEEIEVFVPTKHEFINGKYFPMEFKKGIKYIPTNYKKIMSPLLI